MFTLVPIDAFSKKKYPGNPRAPNDADARSTQV